MQTFDQTLAANASWDTGVAGSYFRLMVAANPVTVVLKRNGIPIYTAKNVLAGLWSRPAGGFDAVTITNGATAQPVQIAVIDGDGGYDHLIVDISSAVSALAVTISGNASVTIAQSSVLNNLAPVTVGIAATALVAASATRKGLRFTNTGTAAVYLGGAGVTVANGAIKIASGQTWIESEAAPAAWYGISGTAGQVVTIQELA